MQQRRNHRSMRDMTIFGGWLFADLLLALTVILLAAQPPFPRIVKPTITPTPTFTPTPTQEPRLELVPLRVMLQNVDYQGVLKNTSSAVQGVERQINGHKELNNRSVGLVIAYGGAPTSSNNDINQAVDIASAVMSNVLKVMGHRRPLFQRASYYDPLFSLGKQPTVVVLDIYLFKQ